MNSSIYHTIYMFKSLHARHLLVNTVPVIGRVHSLLCEVSYSVKTMQNVVTVRATMQNVLTVREF